jgi:hypothetical protein
MLAITEAGLAANGIEPEAAKAKSKGTPKAAANKAPTKASKAIKTAK